MALCASLLFAQEANPAAVKLLPEKKLVPSNQAPPEVNAALTARVKQFYQAHVDGKYRMAEPVVAEESKDAFFAMAKPQYLGFEIDRIGYGEGFKTAEVLVKCEANWAPRGEAIKIKMPAVSEWKLIDGQWYIYFPATTEKQTPFGVMHALAAAGDKDAKLPAIMMQGDPKTAAKRILESVRADKNELTLRGYEHSAGEVKIENGMQGPITLSVDLGGGFNGLSYKIDPRTVKAGGAAVVQFICDPKDASPKPVLNARISVEPTGQVFPVRLNFLLPPEIQKKMPKGIRVQPQQ